MDGRLSCSNCTRVYDPQSPVCPDCGQATIITRQWYDQGNKPPASIAPRAWLWGGTAAVILWAVICLGIGYAVG